jgi:molecular chaperone GrpE
MSKKDEKIRKAYNLEEKLGQAMSSQPVEEVNEPFEDDKESKQEMESNTTIIPVEELDAIKKELEEARRKSEENFDGWSRERADFSNYKKRIDRDQVLSTQNITGTVIKKYLVILDDMERSMKTRPTHGEAAAWAEGMELILRKLQNILESEGVKRIPAEQEQFDPTRHEAITHEDSPDHASGEIIEVVQQGYVLGDRILRPALVRVAR